MNRFNKKLTLTLPEEEALYTHQNDSPLVHDSTNHQKQGFYHLRDAGDCLDSESADHRQENGSRLNFIEFEEFNVHDQGNNSQEKTPSHAQMKDFEDKNTRKSKQKYDNQKKHKRNFTIELPDRDEQASHKSQKYHQNNRVEGMLLFDNVDKFDEQFKQPPAPSKGSKQQKMFVFPTQNSKKTITKESENIEQLKQSFQRERQQFFKEKSKLEKQILVKNGQIQMLEKMVKDKYSPTNSSFQNHYIAPSFQKKDPSISLEQLETIVLQKDIEISDLLERISYLNECIDKKNQEINKKINENQNYQAIIESLKNQLYIFQKKQTCEKLTSNFMKLKIQKQSKEFSRERPRELNMTSIIGNPGWDEQQFYASINNKDFGAKGLINLQKRLQNLHKNRLDLDERSHKIKSDISIQYPHSTRNISKGAFDFSGRVYQPSKKLNRSKKY